MPQAKTWDPNYLRLRTLVGNTPLLAIELRVAGRRRVIHAKAESLNMTGSVKDRMAFHILHQASEDGHLTPGARIFEATSGNTGISFAAIGRSLGHPVSIFMPDWMSKERINLIRSFGAEIHMVTPEQGGFLGSIELARQAARADPDAFLPSQFSNEENCQAHARTTGPEIWWQLKFMGRAPDAFVAGVGTGGTIMGVGHFLRSVRPDVKLHPLEPSNSPTLSAGHCVGQHRIQGISDEFIPPIVDLQALDAILSVDDGDAILMAQQLASTLGLGVGISSGANFLGALLAQDRLDPEAVVVTLFPDSNKKYLSTDLLHDEPVRSHYRTPEIELLGFHASERACTAFFDPLECAEKLDRGEPVPGCVLEPGCPGVEAGIFG